jgi:hypothetical protein
MNYYNFTTPDHTPLPKLPPEQETLETRARDILEFLHRTELDLLDVQNQVTAQLIEVRLRKGLFQKVLGE